MCPNSTLVSTLTLHWCLHGEGCGTVCFFHVRIHVCAWVVCVCLCGGGVDGCSCHQISSKITYLVYLTVTKACLLLALKIYMTPEMPSIPLTKHCWLHRHIICSCVCMCVCVHVCVCVCVHRYFRLCNRDWKRVHICTLARTVLDGLLLSNLTTPTRNRTLMAIDLPSWQFWKAFFLL